MRVSAIQTHRDMYTLVGLEPVAAMKEWWQLNQELPQHIQTLFVKPALAQLATVAGEGASGVVLDPQLGLSLSTSARSGLVLPLTQPKSAEQDPLALPHLDQSWGVVEVANNYGVAKLTLYYHPAEEQAIQKKQLVAELADYCDYQNIDFMLDLVIYTPAGEEFAVQSFQAAQLQAVQELRALPQAFILQYPLDPLACATLTTELDVPWLVSSRGLRYREFKETLRTALEGGAKGFYLYELSWPKVELDTEKLQSYVDNLSKHQSEITEFAQQWLEAFTHELKTTVRDQLLELSRITNEFGDE